MALKIALMQFQPFLGDLDGNLSRALDMLDTVSADIAVFPELFLSGYTFASTEELEQCSVRYGEGPVMEALMKKSRERDMAVCGGYSERAGGTLYNSSFFIDGDRPVANYRKTHLFSCEKKLFAPGDTGFTVFGYRGTALGMMICFDWIFPEAARTLALRGAQVILHPSNLVLPYCQRAMYARALENRVFIVTVNRVGSEKNGDLENSFTGGSQAVSPTGEYLLRMDSEKAGSGVVELDADRALEKKITPLNHILEDRRPEHYG